MSTDLFAPSTGDLTATPAWHSKVASLKIAYITTVDKEHTLVIECTPVGAETLTKEEEYDVAQSVMFAHANDLHRGTLQNECELSAIVRTADLIIRSRAARDVAAGSILPLSPLGGASIRNIEVESDGVGTFKGKASRYWDSMTDTGHDEGPHTYRVELRWTAEPSDGEDDGQAPERVEEWVSGLE